MNDFKYEDKYVDSWGRIRYICKCSVCGKRCDYGRTVKTKPMCMECMKAKSANNAKNKREAVKNKLFDVIYELDGRKEFEGDQFLLDLHKWLAENDLQGEYLERYMDHLKEI